jgi:hypothetical protein
MLHFGDSGRGWAESRGVRRAGRTVHWGRLDLFAENEVCSPLLNLA